MILKNCRILDGGKLIDAHILIDNEHDQDSNNSNNGRISKISVSSIKSISNQVIDIQNKIVIPGAIDSHVHFRDPGQEYKEDFFSGSRAAAAGGVTTVLDM